MATTAELLDFNVSQRSSTFKFVLLDQALAPTGDILKPNSDNPPTLDQDNTRLILRKLDGLNLVPSELAQINPITDRIMVMMVLQNGAELPCGVFMFVDASYAINTYGEDFSGSMLDLGFILDQRTETTYSLNTGTSIDGALASLFDQAGISNYTIDPSGQIIGTPIAWPADSSRYVIMNDLCALRGAYPAYFDSLGRGRVRSVPVITDVPADVTYVKGGNIYRKSLIRKANYLTAPDRYKVVDTAANDTPITGIFDLPDEAPNSFHHRGFHIVKNINEQGLASSSAAIERARIAAVQDANNYQIMSFGGAADPRHDAFSVVDFLGIRYREQAWSMPLSHKGTMSHTLAQVFA